ncbi:MAG: hypothetical protein NTW52_08960 [Planctomycetota bacterium]|nr:hypothetical protein [Planctomycetota bacterium]
MRTRTSDLRIRNPENTQEKQGNSDGVQHSVQHSLCEAVRNEQSDEPKLKRLLEIFNAVDDAYRDMILAHAESVANLSQQIADANVASTNRTKSTQTRSETPKRQSSRKSSTAR